MRSLLIVCFLFGAFFLGGYVDRLTTVSDAPDAPDTESAPADYAGVPMPPVQVDGALAALIALPADARAQPGLGTSELAEANCMPTLLARGMSRADSAHVCAQLVSGLAREH